DRGLDAAVAHLARVDDRRAEARRRRHRQRQDLVAGDLLVIGRVDREAIVEQAELEATFATGRLLRLEAGIRRLIAERELREPAELVGVAGIRRLQLIRTGVGADLGPRPTELQVGQ